MKYVAMSIGMAFVMGITSSVWAASCNDLEIFVLPANWEVAVDQTGCDHGKVVDGSPKKLVIGSVSGGMYGPTCTAIFTGPDKYAVVKFDQALCALKGGTITVTALDGAKPKFTKVDGSFQPAMPGKVTILQFED